MRRTTAWLVVIGVLVLGTARPVSAADGFWVSIASGVAGSSSPTGYQDWWFETPHGPPPVAVTGLSGGTVEATTGGGSSFFNGGAVPVVLHTTDGYAYLAGGTKPSDLSAALKRQTAGGQGLASGTPDATATVPPENAVLLTAGLGDADANGNRPLVLAVTDQQQNPIAGGTVNVPDGGWWVIGLGPGSKDVIPDPDPDPNPGGNNGNPGGNNGNPGGNNGNPGGGDPSPVATPEPATSLLLSLGGLTVGGWRLVNRRRSK